MADLKITTADKLLLKTEDDEPHTVSAYCRVSTNDSDQKNSLEAQKQFFKRYFELHKNWINVGIFSDEGLSGTSLEKRDALNSLIAKAKRGETEIILTKEVSRFSRNVLHLLTIVEELRSRGVYIWFLSDDINTECDDYRERLTQVAANAEQESLKTSRRVKWGQQQQMQLGVVFGRKEMYGYNIVKDEFGKQRFEIIPEEAKVVKNIFEWFASGEGTHRIYKKLKQQGVSTKKYKNGWSTTVILRILRNEKYVGDLSQGKTYTPDPLSHKKKYNNERKSPQYYITNHHPESAIIDRDLWNKVQKILEERAPSEEVKAKHSNRYWSSGKVYCGLCKGRYISYVKKQKNSSYRAWVCFENHRNGKLKQITLDNGETEIVGCNSLRVNDRVLKAALHDIITEYIIPQKDNILNELKNEIKLASKLPNKSQKIEALEKRIEKSKAKIEKLTQGWMNGIVPDSAYQISIGSANQEYEELRIQLQDLLSENSLYDEDVRFYEECIERLENILSLSSEEYNDNFYECITKSIFVYPTNVLEINLSFIPVPIYLHYRTLGRGNNYKAEFTILSDEEFSEVLKIVPQKDSIIQNISDNG